MAANIDANLANWSTTDSSNQPDGAAPADIDADLRRMQSTLKKYLRTIGTDMASAATVDLSTATGEVVNITGTASISSLGIVAAGMRYWLVFGGAATLVHNGTSLILPSGGNVTAAAGDVACFESLGAGNWRALSYLRANGGSVVGGQGGGIIGYAAKAAAYTTTASDEGLLIDYTGSVNATLTLHAAATNYIQGIRNSSLYVLTVDPISTTQINGESSIKLNPGESCIALFNGTSWRTIGLPAKSVVKFDYTTISTSSGTTSIPVSDSIPSSTDGTSVASISFTKLVQANHVLVDATFYLRSTTGPTVAALFRGTTCIRAAKLPASTEGLMFLRAYDTNTAAFTNTYSIRVGTASGTWHVNTDSAADDFGGVLANSIFSMMEIQQ